MCYCEMSGIRKERLRKRAEQMTPSVIVVFHRGSVQEFHTEYHPNVLSKTEYSYIRFDENLALDHIKGKGWGKQRISTRPFFFHFD